MSNTEYNQKQLSQLQWEEKYIKSIIELHEDQLSRLKVEELALKHKISVEEGGQNQDSIGQLNKNREQQAMETDENINALPLMLETNHPYNNEEDEEEDDDDDNEGDSKNYDSLKCFLDDLSQREQNKQ